MRVAIASTLSAGPEMAHFRHVGLNQSVPVGPIAIEAVPGASLEQCEEGWAAENIS